ncbi:hypothetical protein FOZ60_015371 [Perkinsus olseni]|uniref:Cytochrome b5 heme-binding domain-containing protein n=3 Tax=Perkinsus olseni TaxID=32597 RepID=A0A7J6P5U7_PEROL|nr:hypothetical protein FOZ60_015371 [Perkinsus olseni]
MSSPPKRAIVVGGGLAGFSAANTILEAGGRVLLLDKSAFCGGNSSKATSGINGAVTKTQKALNVQDSNELFESDCMKGGAKHPELVKVMVENSGASVDWLMDNFDLDLSLLARLGGHSVERTHRGKERFPGMTITYAEIQMAEAIAKKFPDRCEILNKCRVTKLLTTPNGDVNGVQYTTRKGDVVEEYGPVILATGGFGADFSESGILAKVRPDLLKLSTTNGEHCTGDGIKMGQEIGAQTVDLDFVQVHPTGLVNPKDPDSKVKFLAAEALRGVGGILLDSNGKRFVNELHRRDYVSNTMFKNKAPFRLVLNSKSAQEIHWHCEHYKGRGVMKEFKTGRDLAKEMGISPSVLEQTFKEYNEIMKKQIADPNGGPYEAYPSGKTHDPYGKKFFKDYPMSVDDTFQVAIVTPLVHYTMGGLKINTFGQVLGAKNKPIKGLYAAGEVMGGVHGNNRLGGNSLLDCVAYGRVTGKHCASEDLKEGRTTPNVRAIVVGGGLAGFSAANTILENGGNVILLDKSAFCGGNSSKATSGINGACTKTQKALGVKDSKELFYNDCMKGGAKHPHLVKAMVDNSGSSVNWLMDNFDLDLSLLARLGGHSAERTHRGKERFPGMTITYAEIQMAEAIAKKFPDRCQIINKARVTELLTANGTVVGCKYTDKKGQVHEQKGPVILATGGFGADFSPDGILAKVRPDLLKLATTNGEHCTGDGIKMGTAVGAQTVDLEFVQVHPTGLVNPKDPEAKVKFLAAEALRGVGGILLDADGKRFVNELHRRDYVSNTMFKNKGPFRLVLNSSSAEEIHWHCEHYKGRGVMKEFASGNALAQEMGIEPSVLEQTFKDYNVVMKKQIDDPDNGPYEAYPSGKTHDSFGKKFFKPYPMKMDDNFHVAIVTPLIHYTMGGLKIDDAGRVLGEGDKPIEGLYAAGELMGGVHGNNRLGGNSLLDCVVYGRLSGKDCATYMMKGKTRPVPLKCLKQGLTKDVKTVIVIGGGLAGFSACNTVLEKGGQVLLLDKSAFCGGNSSKATSGINGACTKTQQALGIKDSNDLFYSDCMKGGAKKPDLVNAMVQNSGASVNWLMDNFDLDLSLLARLGGHSVERTHRGKERFPGMTITYAEIQMAEAIAKNHPDKCKIMNKARATKLLTGEDGSVTGVVYETKDGQTHEAHGPVILATGGFGADFSPDGILAKVRPDLLGLSTTNGEHCTGDGIKMGMEVGADTLDLEFVQVHPTGLVNPKDPKSKVKFLAAEALRGVGGILLDADGNRFVNELHRRDYVSNTMFKNKGPFRLVLNSKSAQEIHWHCEHYKGRGVMKEFATGAALAAEMGIPTSKLEQTFKTYNEVMQKQIKDPDGGPYDAYPSGKTHDPFGKKFFKDYPMSVNDTFQVAIVTPLVHYTMGGLTIDPKGRVLNKSGKVIKGLYAAGEVMGGVHGNNRLGGNSLLDCVVYGRLTGADCATYAGADEPVSLKQLKTTTSAPAAAAAPAAPAKAAPKPAPVAAPVPAAPTAKHNTKDDCWVVINGDVLNVTDFLPDHPGGDLAIMTFAGRDASTEFNMIHPPDVIEKYAPESVLGQLLVVVSPLEDVGKHNTKEDCWVVINGQVLDVTEFLPDHPGGELAILTFAGRDATHEFNMIHPPDVIEKYAPEAIIGELGVAAPAGAPAAAAAPAAPIPANGKTLEEVAKHNTKEDCWVVINGQVLDVTEFLPDHPGGDLAILTFAGRDATNEFNMIHPPDVIEKYAADSILGPLVQAAAQPAAPAVGGGLTQPLLADPKVAKEQWWGEDRNTAVMHGPLGESMYSYCAGVFYFAWLLILETLKTIFTVKNYKVIHDKSGLTRSAMFLIVFVIIHGLGNLHCFFGPDHFNGYAYFLNHPCPWSALLLPVEIYLLAAGLLHVAVGLVRTYKFKTINTAFDQLWLIVTGVVLLVFLIVHLMQFRLVSEAGAPQYYFRAKWMYPFFCDKYDTSCEVVHFKDLYKLEFQIFEHFGWVCFYLVGVTSFILHVREGLRKVIAAHPSVPRKYKGRATTIGNIVITLLGLIYLSYPIFCYFAPVKSWAKYDEEMIQPGTP